MHVPKETFKSLTRKVSRWINEQSFRHDRRLIVRVEPMIRRVKTAEKKLREFGGAVSAINGGSRWRAWKSTPYTFSSREKGTFFATNFGDRGRVGPRTPGPGPQVETRRIFFAMAIAGLARLGPARGPVGGPVSQWLKSCYIPVLS